MEVERRKVPLICLISNIVLQNKQTKGIAIMDYMTFNVVKGHVVHKIGGGERDGP